MVISGRYTSGICRLLTNRLERRIELEPFGLLNFIRKVRIQVLGSPWFLWNFDPRISWTFLKTGVFQEWIR